MLDNTNLRLGIYVTFTYDVNASRGDHCTVSVTVSFLSFA